MSLHFRLSSIDCSQMLLNNGQYLLSLAFSALGGVYGAFIGLMPMRYTSHYAIIHSP